MNATDPLKPSIILATPINVEESRAQRLQRQQARFRDRGGLFVPTSRSTLLDILLGKASPLKKLHRSASASPSRADGEKSLTGNEVPKPASRRSLRKEIPKTTVVNDRQQPPAMTDDPELEVSKPIKKTTSSQRRPQQQKTTTAPAQSTTTLMGGASESMQAFGVAEDNTNAKECGTSHQSLTQKASRRTFATLVKRSLKASTRRIIANANDDAEDDVLIVKSKPKSKRVSKMKTQGVGDGAKGTPKTRGRRLPLATTSTAMMDSNRVKRAKKVESVHSESSSDDSACKPKKKRSTKKAKDPSKSSLAQKGEDEERNSKMDVEVSLKSLNASDDKSNDDVPLNKFKSKRRITSSQEKPRGGTGRLESTKEVEFVYSAYEPPKRLPTKKSTTQKVKTSAASLVAKRYKSPSCQKDEGVLNINETTPCQLPDIPREDEDGLGKEDMAPSGSSSNSLVSSKGKRRASTSITRDSDSQPLRKRIKPGTSLHQNLNSNSEVPLTSQKRRCDPGDVESAAEGVDKSAKRKRLSGQSESRGVPKISVKEVNVQPDAKKPSKTGATRKTKNQTTAPKRKENPAIFKPFKEKNRVTSTGPPTSVLQRIKDSLGAQVVDDEPDPIDFLS